jgi:transcriptional regulator GlxA family with amidase domain
MKSLIGRERMESKTIAILVTPGVQVLDVSAPRDVFAEANVQAGPDVYQLRVFGSVPGAILSSSGVSLMPDAVIGNNLNEKIDTLLVVGVPNGIEASLDASVVDWLRDVIPSVRRYGSICPGGAFFLAKAGLLDGRRVAAHWAVADRLAQVFPSVTLDPNASYVRDGRLRTAAGATAGLDLALALVEEDLGREVALKVAGQFVMFIKGPRGQIQFSREGEADLVGRSALQEAQRWIADNPAEDLSIANLARRTGLSPRHLTRVFRQEVGVTPATWVKEARVAAARRLLESGEAVPKQVAAQCGFANADTLRRVFVRLVGVTPAEYRRRFQVRG